LSSRRDGCSNPEVDAIGYRLRASLRTGWPGIVGLTMIVAIAGGLVLTLVAGAVRTLTAPDRYVDEQTEMFDVQIQQESGAPRAAELGALASTGRVETATFVFGGLLAPGSEEPEDLLIFAGSETPLGAHLVDGRRPTASPSEFVVTRSFFDSSGARLGQHYRLVTLTAAQAEAEGFDAGRPEGPSFDATLVGVIDGPAELADDYPVALFPSRLLDAGDIGVAATVVSVGLAPESDIGDVRTDVAQLPSSTVFSVEPAAPIGDEVRAAISAQGQGLAVLAAIAAVTTIVVLGQLLSRQYRRSEPERVVLSSLGLTRTQLILEPVARGAIPVAVGTIAAAVLAYLCSSGFPRGFVTQVEPHPGRLLEPVVHLAGPVALALAILAWLLSSTTAAGRDVVPDRSTSLADRVAPVLPGTAAALGLRFAFPRGPGRPRSARASLLGLILVAGLVFAALTFGRNLTTMLDEPARYGVNFDLALGQGGEVSEADVLPLLDDPKLSPDIAGLTLYGSLPVDAGSASLYVIGMQPLRGDLLPEVLSGRLPAGPDEIAIGRVSARKLRVGVGDTVTLRTKKGEQTLRVTGTVQPPPVGGADVVGDSGVVTAEAFDRIAPGQPMDTAVVDLAPGAPADAAERIAAATGMAAGQAGRPPAVINVARVRSIPFLVAAVVGALAVLSLGHQLLVAVRRRRLDHAVLRALGASRRDLTGIIHLQATIITAAVLALAVPLGIAAGSTVYRPFVDRIGARADLVVPLWWALAAALAMVVLANLVAAIPARRARRSSPARTLARL